MTTNTPQGEFPKLHPEKERDVKICIRYSKTPEAFNDSSPFFIVAAADSTGVTIANEKTSCKIEYRDLKLGERFFLKPFKGNPYAQA